MEDIKEYFLHMFLKKIDFHCFGCNGFLALFLMKSTSLYFKKVPNLPGSGCSFFTLHFQNTTVSLIASFFFLFVFFAKLTAEILFRYIFWKKINKD